jgi:competence protein ComFB
VGLRDRYDFDSLVNEAERLVLEELESQLAREAGTCQCQDCVLDMAALAMNNVRPAYRVSLLGSVYAGAQGQATQGDDIRRAVRDAVRKIRENPSHD